MLIDHFEIVHNWDIIEIPNEVDDIVNELLAKDLPGQSQFTKNKIIAINSNLSTREYDMIMNVLTFMEVTPLDYEVYRDEFASLQEDYDQIGWDLEMSEGVLYGGFISVASNSLEFWTNHSINSGTPNIQPIYTDAWAYAAVWAAEYLSDCVVNDPCPGSTCPCPGEQDRINTATLAAAAASAGI